MTDQSPLLDPEVEAIMREVAQDPDSVLLRVDRPKELRVIDAGGDTIVRGRVGLSNAEKQLLEVHREEAAYLLRLAYYELARQLAAQRSKGLIYYPSGTEADTLGKSGIQRRLRGERESHSEDGDVQGAIDIGLSVLVDPSARLVDLAMASLRLVPSLSARSYVGSEYQFAGHHYSAGSVYERLCHDGIRPGEKAVFLSKLALVFSRTGRYVEWRERIRSACELAPTEDRALTWLAASIRTGHMAQAQDATKLVNDLWPTPTEHASGWLSAARDQRIAGLWEPVPARIPDIETLSGIAGRTATLALNLLRGEG